MSRNPFSVRNRHPHDPAVGAGDRICLWLAIDFGDVIANRRE